MSNPYATPDAALDTPAIGDDTYEPRMFAVNGRIGRLRYLAYGFGTTIIFMFGAGILSAIAIPLLGRGAAAGIGMAALALIYISAFAISIIMMKRRFNDLNHTGWWSLLMFVPFVNLIVGLYLMLAPGSAGPNDYGLPPSKNSTLLVVLGLVLPIVAIVGILAAVAIPAYQQYVIRAKAAQAMQQQHP